MTKNERIKELILEIDFGINKIDDNENTIKDSPKYNNKIEKEANDNLLKLEKAFFDKILKENDGKFN